MNQSQIADIESASHQILMQHSELRIGQSFFNALEEQYPKIANKIRGTNYDCYYNDAVLPLLKQHLLTLI